MTQTQQWMLLLWMVYGTPSFIAGIGLTVLMFRWQEVRKAAGALPRFLTLTASLEQNGPLTARFSSGTAIGELVIESSKREQ